MHRPRSQRVLWALTGVLVLALPLVGFLQVRWARQLGEADVERLRTSTIEQLEAAGEELQTELTSWSLALQGMLDFGPPLVNPRPAWQLASPLRDVLDDVFLLRYAESADTEVWYHLPPTGEPRPLAAAPVSLEDDGFGPLGLSLFPRPLDDQHMVMRIVMLQGDLLPMLTSPTEDTVTVRNQPSLVVLLDRSAVASWIEGVLARRLGRPVQALDYGVAISGAGFEDLWVAGTPGPMAGTPDDILHRVDVVIEARDALGHALVARTSACEASETCGQDDTTTNDQGEAPDKGPRLFVSLPDTAESWRLEVRNHRTAMDPRLRTLWARNLAIGLAALAVLAIAVGLLIALTVQYQRLARAQFDFVTGVTHELQTPLSVLAAASANLADGLISDDPRVRHYGEVQRKEVRRLRELVERVLGFTRAQTDPNETARAALADSVERVVRRLAAETTERGVDLEIDVADRLPDIAVHPWLLDSLLQNLLSNALKYGGDRVRIEAAPVRKRRRTVVRLTMRDWGPGLTRFERRRIFEPFFRGRKARDEQQPGAGLGLSWVARLVQRAGGRLRVESKPGDGSRFGVELPVVGGST